MSDPRQRATFARPVSQASASPYDSRLPGRSDALGSGYLQPPWQSRINGHSLEKPSNGYDTPSRISSPAPNPFAIPTLAVPPMETVRFVALCILWYGSSALSSNTGKVIMQSFRFPVTMTIIQFFFVAGYCVIVSKLGWTAHLRSISRQHIQSTLPMAAFQVGGHICSSLAISRVPVSTVHTIKALSPLFTVLAYAVLFSVSYSPATYVSLLPLTFGVMLACSSDMSASNIFGLVCAFGSTLIFVSQNIFFKKVMPTNAEVSQSGRLDKINLLFFSSSLAFLLMIPVWIYSDFWRLITYHNSSPKSDSAIVVYFFLNGTVHFAQNLLAFAILSSTSPVTYSIASLVKRIAVICLAIVWFKQSVHVVQGLGIALTAVGLWMYNNSKRDVEKGEKKMRQVEAVREGVLPQSKGDAIILDEGHDHRYASITEQSLYPATSPNAMYKARPSPPPSTHHHRDSLPNGRRRSVSADPPHADPDVLRVPRAAPSTETISEEASRPIVAMS